jgi:uncharacterized repeat protein (TIGR02543 family)
MAKDSWLTVNPMSGKGNATLRNSGTPHKGRLQRSTVVTAVVKDMAEGKSYSVNQKPSSEYLTLDKTEFSIGEAGGNVTVTGKSNSARLTFTLGESSAISIPIPTTYTVNSFSNSTSAAITGDPGAKDEFTFSITFAIPRNLGAERVGVIVVQGSSSTVSAIANITQAVATFKMTYTKGDYINTISKTEETVQYGGTATCTATLLANTQQYSYTFDGWYEGSTKVGSALALSVANISTARSFTAKGKRITNQYTLSTKITPTGGGTTTGAGKVDWGTKLSVTATPATGYNFTNWVYRSTSYTDNPYTVTVTQNETIEAVFTLKKYRITTSAAYRVAESGDFTAGTTGGTVTASADYNHGSTVSLVASPATGYSFEGWYEGTTLVYSGTTYSFTATQARTLVGRFQRRWFTITFTAGTGGKVAPTSARVQWGGSASSTATANTGYTFSGWSDGTKTATISKTNIQADASYAASFGIDTYVVTYVADTGIASVDPTSQSVEHGSNASGSTATVSTGYDFSGWYEGSTRIFTTLATGSFGPITGNRTLTAKATIKTFAITAIAQFKNTDGGTSYTEGTDGGTVTGGGTYNYGSTATLTASAKTGYTFVGWYSSSGVKESNQVSIKIENITAPVTRYARFDKIWNTVTYTKNNNIASVTPTSQRVSYGSSAASTAALPATTAEFTYSFDGWYEGTTKVGSDLALSVTNITGARTFQARGIATTRSYTITATSENTTYGTVTGGGSYKYNATVTLTATRKTGYTFSGWYEGTTRVSTSATYTFTCTGARTLVAKWAVYNLTITVTWSPTASKGTVSGSLTGQEGTKTTLNFTPATAYNFDHWENNAGTTGGQNETFTFGTTTSITVFCTMKTYTVSYTKGTGITAVSRASETVNYGANAAGSTATVQTGYTFDGWYNGSTKASSSVTFAPTNVTATVTYEARATINKFTVTASPYFRNTDGTGNYASGTDGGTVTGGGSVNYGGSSTVTAAAKTGYQFDGWYTAGATGGTLLSSNAAYTITNVTANQTVYARFSRIYYTVTYTVGNYVTSVSRTSERVAKGANALGSTMTINATTDQFSYAVDGWYNGSTKASSSATYAPTNVQGAMTLQARATQTTRSYTVTYVKGDYISAVSRASESVLYNGNAAGSTATVMATTDEFSYSFDGWYNGSTRVSTALTYAPTEVKSALTLTAKGKRTSRTYTATIYGAYRNTNGTGNYTQGTTGGEAGPNVSGTYNAEVTVKMLSIATGYKFDGWAESLAANATILSTSQSYTFKITKNITLYGRTTKQYFAVAVQLDSTSAGRGSVSGGGTVAYGTSMTVTCTMSKPGDVFDGWYEGSTRVSTSLSYTFSVTKARTLVAKILYIDVTPTSLDYEAGGGTKTITVTSNVGSWTVS